jgi:ABC-type oligopeptide transport system ATPase subunit
MADALLEVRALSKEFRRHRLGMSSAGSVRAVDNVSFSIQRGRTLGLVGQSGSGKSTTARCIVRLLEPSEGSVHLGGRDVTRADRGQLLKLRRNMQMVFQDPYSSLDPRMTIESIVGEGLTIHRIGSDRAERRERISEVLSQVGLSSEHMPRYPHEFSGGQRQRISIARALAVDPDLLICDEPVSSLDVSIAAQIMNLFKRLQSALGLTILFISHDLAMIRHISHDVAVMYDGRIVEQGPREQIYADPQHDYTRALLAAKPLPDPVRERNRRSAASAAAG